MLRGHPALQRTHLCDLHAFQKDDRPCHRPEQYDPILRWRHGFFVAQNYKSCHGMLMLARKFDAKRLEAACNRLKDASSASYSMVKRILNAGLDRMQTDEIPEAPLPVHENIRGGNEYQ